MESVQAARRQQDSWVVMCSIQSPEKDNGKVVGQLARSGVEETGESWGSSRVFAVAGKCQCVGARAYYACPPVPVAQARAQAQGKMRQTAWKKGERRRDKNQNDEVPVALRSYMNKVKLRLGEARLDKPPESESFTGDQGQDHHG